MQNLNIPSLKLQCPLFYPLPLPLALLLHACILQCAQLYTNGIFGHCDDANAKKIIATAGPRPTSALKQSFLEQTHLSIGTPGGWSPTQHGLRQAKGDQHERLRLRLWQPNRNPGALARNAGHSRETNPELLRPGIPGSSCSVSQHRELDGAFFICVIGDGDDGYRCCRNHQPPIYCYKTKFVMSFFRHYKREIDSGPGVVRARDWCRFGVRPCERFGLEGSSRCGCLQLRQRLTSTMHFQLRRLDAAR